MGTFHWSFLLYLVCCYYIWHIVTIYRSLVANLAAANCFTKNHLDESQHWEMVTTAKYYYIAVSVTTPPPPSQLVSTVALVTEYAALYNINM